MAKRSFSRERWLWGVGLASLLVVLGYFSFTGYRLFYQEVPLTSTHGPRLAQTPEAVAGATELKLKQQKNTSPNPLPAPRPSPLNGLSYGYGIAAGGHLPQLDAAELEAFFIELKALGVGWVRWDLKWSAVQPEGASSFGWEYVDRIVTTSQKFGIRPLAVLSSTPEWARKADCAESDMCPPADPAEFARFAGRVAERYADKGLNHFEIWNEPNYKNFWLPQPDIDEYQRLLEATYSEVKAVNSSAAIIAGGLAAVGDEAGHIAPLTFVEGLYARGAQNSLDAVAVHPYSYPALPSYETWWNRWQQLKPIHDVMAAAGDEPKKVWITEIGAPTGGSGRAHTTAELNDYLYGEDFMTESAQSDILADAVALYQNYSAWSGPFFWYSLRDTGTSSSTPENFFGLLRHDGSKKPAYHTFQSILRQAGR